MSQNMGNPEKSEKPDRASDNDLEGVDVPTYTPQRRPRRPKTVYERTGRAEPQSIPARDVSRDFSDEPEPTMDLRHEQADSEQASQQVSRDPEPTMAFGAASAGTSTAASRAEQDFSRDYGHTAANSEPTAYLGETQPQSEEATTAEPSVHVDDDEENETRPESRRGTTDLGLLIMRVAFSAWLILDSLATFFQLGGNPGISGLSSEMSGYSHSDIVAVVLPSAELAGGVFLLLGLITPLFAAVATVATGYLALHSLAQAGVGLAIFEWQPEQWLPLVLFGLSIAIQFTGPGLYSLDLSRGWARRPLASSWLFIIVGVAVLGAAWWFTAKS